MSRCLPYPPPGYERKNVVHDEALIESIKLQREREKAKKERKKEKKREKKEKEKDKKEKPRESGEIEKKKQCHKKRHKDERSKVYHKEGDHPKRGEDETEQLEKSSLTEEHGHPASVQNLYDSSDSTQNSSKRKKHRSPSDDNHNHGSVLRIRLPLLKHKDLEPSKDSTGRTEIIAHKKTEIAPRSSKEQPCSTSGRTEIPAQDKIEPAPRSSFLESGLPELDTLFKGSIENWAPLPIQSELDDFDDQEWLFRRKPHQRHEAKRFKASDGASCHVSSSLWPVARYLAEADIYALPFTVPY